MWVLLFLNSRVFFSDLKFGGKCFSVGETRLLWFWEVRNVKRGGELMLVDVNMVPRSSKDKGIKEIVFLSWTIHIPFLGCCQCNWKDEYLLELRLVRQIWLKLIHGITWSELIGLTNTNTQLPDIIGEIIGVKSTVCDPPEEKNRVCYGEFEAGEWWNCHFELLWLSCCCFS